MNYKPNEIKWKIGNIVIHDLDRKAEYMLMKVIKIEQDEGGILYHTRYLVGGNHTNQRKVYINDKKFLHDPKRFGIKLPKSEEIR